MFTTAKDVESASETEEIDTSLNIQGNAEAKKHNQEHTPRAILDDVRQKALNAFNRIKGVSLIAHKRSQFWTSDKTVRAVCPVSKMYETGGYWYAFHPHQRDFLSEAEQGFLILGCIGSDVTYAIPYNVIVDILPFLNITDRGHKSYWHIHLETSEDGNYSLLVPKRERLSLAQYKISLVDLL